jgi:type I restriction enzyme S subunit
MKNKLSEGWKEIELGNIFEFQKKSKIKAGDGLDKGKYKFFTSSDKQTKFIDEFTQDGEYLIFTTGGHAGIHYCNEKFATSTDCFVVKVNNIILTKYVYYYLFDKIYLLEEGFKGAGLKHISKGYIQKIKIISPENKEIQQKIVSILEKIEKAKEWRKDADKLTKNFLKSIYANIFSNIKDYDVVELKELVDEFRFGTSSKSGNKGYYVLGIPNVLGDNLILENCKKVKLTEKEYLNWKLLKGDILFVRTNGNPHYIGRCGIFELSEEGFVFASYLIRARIKKKLLNPYFLKTFLESSIGRKELITKCRTTAGQYNINTQGLGSIKIPLPPLNLQNKFEIKLKDINKLKEQQKHSKNKIDNLFNALMQKAFKGELT